MRFYQDYHNIFNYSFFDIIFEKELRQARGDYRGS